MGCSQQKFSSSKKRNDESITTGQLDSNQTSNVVSVKCLNQKQIGSKMKSRKYQNFLLNRVVLSKDILNSSIMVRRQKNQEALTSKKEYATSFNGCN